MLRRPSWEPTYSHLRGMIFQFEMNAAGAVILPALHRDRPRFRIDDLIPKTAQALQAALWRIASDDRSVNRADRNPRHPVGQIFRGRQRLINSRLVAPKGTPALQNQANFFVIGLRTRGRVSISHKALLEKHLRCRM